MEQKHSGSGDNVGGDKIEKQVNVGEGGQYVDNRRTEIDKLIVINPDSQPSRRRILWLLITIGTIFCTIILFLLLRPNSKKVLSIALDDQRLTKAISFESGVVTITFEGRTYQDQIDLNSSATFVDLPVDAWRGDQPVVIRFSAGTFFKPFEQKVILDSSHLEIPLTYNEWVSRFCGYIKDSETRPVVGAKVCLKLFPEDSTRSDEEGFYELKIPEAHQRLNHIVQVEESRIGKSEYNFRVAESCAHNILLMSEN